MHCDGRAELIFHTKVQYLGLRFKKKKLQLKFEQY